MLVAFVLRLLRIAGFVFFCACFFSACYWVKLLVQVGCWPRVVNAVGGLMGARWALRAIWWIAPGWVPGKKGISGDA